VRWYSPTLDNDIVNVKRTINTTTEFNLRQHRDISLSAGVMVSLTATLVIASSLEFVSVAADVTMDAQQDTEIRRIITEHIGRCHVLARAQYSQQQLRASVTDSIPCYCVLCLNPHYRLYLACLSVLSSVPVSVAMCFLPQNENLYCSKFIKYFPRCAQLATLYEVEVRITS